MRKLILFLCILSTAFALLGASTDKDMNQRKELAGKLLERLGVKRQIIKSFTEIKSLQSKIIDKTLKNAPESEEVRTFRNKLSAISDDLLSWNNLKSDFIEVYAEAYSVAELKEMNAFFSSPAGKKFIEKTPRLQKQLVPIIQDRIKSANRKVRTMAHEFMKEQMLSGKTVMPENLKAVSKGK